MDHVKFEEKPAALSARTALPTDITLLLRCHAEGCFLAAEVLPAIVALREARNREDRLGALAYLEGRWSQAQLQALATDSCFDALRAVSQPSPLAQRAWRYYRAVRNLRDRARRELEAAQSR